MVREANVKQATAEKQLKEAQGKVRGNIFIGTDSFCIPFFFCYVLLDALSHVEMLGKFLELKLRY